MTTLLETFDILLGAYQHKDQPFVVTLSLEEEPLFQIVHWRQLYPKNEGFRMCVYIELTPKSTFATEIENLRTSFSYLGKVFEEESSAIFVGLLENTAEKAEKDTLRILRKIWGASAQNIQVELEDSEF